MRSFLNWKMGLALVIILLAAISRIVPHIWNFTPIAAMALFGAAYFPKKWFAIIIPFAAMWLSDLYLINAVYAPMYPDYYGEGFHFFGVGSVYLSFFLIAGIGFLMLRKVSLMNVIGASLLGSIAFFLITNAGSWLFSPLYTKDWTGLTASYAAGLPFFRNTLMGDLFYVGLLFGSFELVKYLVKKPQVA